MHTQDIVDVNVGIIGKLFPNCLTERSRSGISSLGRGSVRL